MRALDALDLDAERLALRAGISHRHLRSKSERVPQPQMTKLWHLAEDASGDPYLGLHVARHVSPSTFGALTHATYASSNMESAFKRIVRYQHMMTDSLKLGTECSDVGYRLTIEPFSPDEPPDVEIDAFCATWVRTMRQLTSHRGGVDPTRVSWRRPKPRRAALYRRVFRAPIEFAAKETYIEYARRDSEMLLPDVNPELVHHYERFVANDVAQLESSSTTERVRGLLIDSLSEGPSQAAVARALRMSRSSLKTALSREGSTFQGILTDLRSELACDYLSEGNYSIKEIAFLLGFSDATTFTRAFRNWTGQPPGRFVSEQRRRDQAAVTEGGS